MNNTIEKRVVEFEFDNRDFEKNVKQSEASLKRLKANGLNFDKEAKAIDEIASKISMIEVVAVTTMANIANKVTNEAIKLVKALSTDNLVAGWSKYEEKVIAVGTMASQSLKVAGRELTDQAEKMAVINELLSKLNWFTDETSYNFTDMVNSIGKFTANGVDLDVAVKSMMGIANWAAMSGQNAYTASNAMYQLAQAIGAGSVKLQDWKSIENANMATKEFKQTVIDTAVALGKLTKSGNDYITKTGKKLTVNTFRESLSDGWFTSDILNKSLDKYSAAVDKVYELTQETGLNAAAVIERYSSELDEFGIKAFRAAQEARTFSQAVGAIKDAVSTGWMNTAEFVFGGYEESKKVFSELANRLYDVFAEGGNKRNDILSSWIDKKGRDDLLSLEKDAQGALWNILDSVGSIIGAVRSAWSVIFPLSEYGESASSIDDIGNRLKNLTERLKASTSVIKEFLTENESLQNIFEGLSSVVKVLTNIFLSFRYAVSPIIDTIKELSGILFDFLGEVGLNLTNTDNVVNTIMNTSQKVNLFVSKLMETLRLSDVLQTLLNTVRNLAKVVKNSISIFKNAFGIASKEGKTFEVFANGISDMLSLLSNSINALINLLNNSAVPVLSKIINFLSGFIGKIAGYATYALELLGRLLTSIKQSVSAYNSVGDAMRSTFKIIQNGIGVVKNYFDAIFNGAKKIQTVSAKKKRRGDGAADVIYETIETAIGNENALDNIKKYLSAFLHNLQTVFSAFLPIINELKKTGPLLIDAITAIIKTFNAGISLFIKLCNDVTKINFTDGFDAFIDSTKEYMRIGMLIAIFAALTKVVVMALRKTRNFSYVLGALGDYLYTLRTSLMIDGIIKSVAVSILAFAASISVLIAAYTANSDAFWNAVNAVTLITGIISILTTVVLLASKKTDILFKGFKDFSAKFNSIAGVPRLLYAIAATLMSVSASIAILSAIPIGNFDKINEILRSIMISIGAIVVVASILGFVTKQASSIKMGLLGLVEIVSSLAIMAVIAKEISEMDTESLAYATSAFKFFIITLGSIVGLLGVLTTVLSIYNGHIIKMDKEGNKAKALTSSNNSISEIIDAISKLNMSFLALSASLVILTKLPVDKMWIGIGAITTLLLVLGGIIVALTLLDRKTTILLDVNGKAYSSISSVIESISKLVTSIGLLSASLYVMSKIEPGKLWCGLAVISILIIVAGGMALLLDRFSKDSTIVEKEGEKASGKISEIIKAMAALFAAISSLVVMIYALSFIDTAKLYQTVGAISILFVATSLIFASMGSIKPEGKLKTIVSLIAVVTAIGGLLASVLLLQNIDPTKVISIIGGISVALLSIAAILAVISSLKSIKTETLIAMSASLILISTSLVIFAEAIKSLASIGDTAGTLLLMVGAIGAFAAAVLLLSVIAPIIAASIPVLLAMSAALFVTSLSLQLVSNALASLLVSLSSFSENMTAVLGMITALISTTITSICETISQNGELILETIRTLLQALFDASFGFLSENLPTILNFVVDFLTEVVTRATELIEPVKVFIQTLLDAIYELLRDNFQRYVVLIIDNITESIKALRNRMPELVQALTDILKILLTNIANNVGDIIDLVATIICNIFDGIGRNIEKVIKSGIKLLMKTIQALGRAIKSSAYEFGDTFAEFGMNLMAGLWNGMVGALANLLSRIPIIGGAVADGFREVFEIHSPSKVMAEMGEYLMAGLSVGMEDGTKGAVNAASEASSSVLRSMNDCLSSELNSDLTLTPVVDLSEVRKGARDIVSIMDSMSGSEISMSSNLATTAERTSRLGKDYDYNRKQDSITNNNTTNETYNVVFNVETNDPESLANETDKILQRKHRDAKMARGG